MSEPPLPRSVRLHMKSLHLSFAKYLVTAIIALGVLGGAAHAKDIDVPKRLGSVTDLAHLLKPKERAAIEAILAAFEKETSHQIAVLTVPTLGSERIETLSLRTARNWQIGKPTFNNGILVTVARKEGFVRIELGRGFEKYISNTDAKSIVDDNMLPSMRDRNYFAALHRGLDRLMEVARRYVVPIEAP